MKCATSEEVQAFCESISADSTKSLGLLKAIDQTVTWLSRIQKRTIADFEFATKETESIIQCDYSKEMDPEGNLSALIESSENDLNELYQLLILKREAAIKAAELDGEDKELIVSEYTSTIAAVADLHNAMNNLKWAIMENDADSDNSSSKPYADIEEMFADMGL